MRDKMNFVSIFKRELVRVILSNLIRIARVRNTGESERGREREREMVRSSECSGWMKYFTRNAREKSFSDDRRK